MTDTYQYTQNEARAEILENKKAEIDAQIADLRGWRELAWSSPTVWANLDRLIDDLLLQKDNLTSGWIVDVDALAELANNPDASDIVLAAQFQTQL